MAAAGGSFFQRFWAWRKANPYREYLMSTHFWVLPRLLSRLIAGTSKVHQLPILRKFCVVSVWVLRVVILGYRLLRWRIWWGNQRRKLMDGWQALWLFIRLLLCVMPGVWSLSPFHLAACVYLLLCGGWRLMIVVTPRNYLLFACHVINETAQLGQGYRYMNYWQYFPSLPSPSVVPFSNNFFLWMFG